ncbi:sulfotransferase [Candidatus Chloroploca sp. M-50]|uniref:Sulfotransferase n=1 Tax=Candidatus Chloroploca mongolica TaxID=2528176 RepID=A0ABS4D476_9CHLR|nr:sulfotransferase [Candidatus Chloroploca mongolica]MBP1464223.1 sulfotransferase [Candidatus Chloroploca mongolica]
MMLRRPEFIVLGAQKAGTTALRHVLAQHPQVYLPTFPEPAFFSFEGGAPSYGGPQSPTSRFGMIPTVEAYEALYANALNDRILGDISSHYSYCWPEQTAACMHRYVPHARLIAILRQPADRAYSAFNMMRQKGLEPLADFAAALAAEDRPQRTNWTPDFRYRHNGRYSIHLAPYFRLFGAQQIRIFLYEEWTTSPAWVIAEICRFLGLAEQPLELNGRHRESLRPRSLTVMRMLRQARRLSGPLSERIPAMLRSRLHTWLWVRPAPLLPAVRRDLTASYAADIQRLEELIQRDLRHWLADHPRPYNPAEANEAGDTNVPA